MGGKVGKFMGEIDIDDEFGVKILMPKMQL